MAVSPGDFLEIIGKFVKANIQSFKTIALFHVFYAPIFGMESETHFIEFLFYTGDLKDRNVSKKKGKILKSRFPHLQKKSPALMAE